MGKRKKHKQAQLGAKPTASSPKKQTAATSTESQAPNSTSLEAFPFEPEDNILLVGEGNFSFALSLILEHGQARITATCYDSEQICKEKHQVVEDNVSKLQKEDATVLYGIDAKNLHKTAAIRKAASGDRGFDGIIFNFPHVGGKSTDVNRQVRYNQELIVSFFKSACQILKPEGTIMVTLFESEPYTLWNIRDLGRHCGLKVARSFQFNSEDFPGYTHARTLGDIEGGGAWRGENRKARSYLFQKADEKTSSSTPRPKSSKKRKRRAESSDDSD